MKHKILLVVVLSVAIFGNIYAGISGGIMSRVIQSNSAYVGSYTHLKYPSWGDRTHFGIDVLDSWNCPIRSVFSGTIVKIMEAGGAYFGSLGNAVMIRHVGIGQDQKPLYSLYLHLNSISNVWIGKDVNRDDIIGYMGKTGAANDVIHLHFELRYFDTWFSANTGNIYANGDVRNVSWAVNDWEDPLTFQDLMDYQVAYDYTFPDHSPQGWSPGWDVDEENGADQNTWQLRVDGPNPSIISP